MSSLSSTKRRTRSEFASSFNVVWKALSSKGLRSSMNPIESIMMKESEESSLACVETFRADVESVVKGFKPISFDSDASLLNSVVLPL
jgi:hypothetical protein